MSFVRSHSVAKNEIRCIIEGEDTAPCNGRPAVGIGMVGFALSLQVSAIDSYMKLQGLLHCSERAMRAAVCVRRSSTPHRVVVDGQA